MTRHLQTQGPVPISFIIQFMLNQSDTSGQMLVQLTSFNDHLEAIAKAIKDGVAGSPSYIMVFKINVL